MGRIGCSADGQPRPKNPAKPRLPFGFRSFGRYAPAAAGILMSFRTRLTSFFVLIVITPMLALGFLVFRLLSDSQQGKADARANGLTTAAAILYQSERLAARAGAHPIV